MSEAAVQLLPELLMCCSLNSTLCSSPRVLSWLVDTGSTADLPCTSRHRQTSLAAPHPQSAHPAYHHHHQHHHHHHRHRHHHRRRHSNSSCCRPTSNTVSSAVSFLPLVCPHSYFITRASLSSFDRDIIRQLCLSYQPPL